MAKKVVLFRPCNLKLFHSYKHGIISRDYYLTGVGIPISLLYIAAPLVAEGYSVKIIDEFIDEDYDTHLQADIQDAICVGITMVGGVQIPSALNFADKVRALSTAPIIWGGYHISALPEQSLRDSRVDIAVVGEGEATLLDIVHALEQGASLEGIPGCWYKHDGVIRSNSPRPHIDLDSLPPLPYHLIPVESYIFGSAHDPKLRGFRLTTSRGCNHNCRYCATSALYRHSWRPHKLDTIIGSMKDFIARYGINYFIFIDDNFFADKTRVEEFCQRLIQEGLKVAWTSMCRVDYLKDFNPEFIALLTQSGLDYLALGVESGSTRMLDYVHKPYTPETIISLLTKVSTGKSGIKYFCYFLTGFPLETKADVYQSLRLLHHITALPNVYLGNFVLYIPFPGTSIFEECLQLGLKLPDRLEAWGEEANIPNAFSPSMTKFYHHTVALAQNMISFDRIKIPGTLPRPHWLRFRLWLLYALKWEWTLFLKSRASKIKARFKALCSRKSRVSNRMLQLALGALDIWHDYPLDILS